MCTRCRTSALASWIRRRDLIAQPPGGLPLFVGDLDAAVADGLAAFAKEGFAPGDVIITNHTGTCGHHLNNIVVYTPAFHDGKLIGFPVTRAHWTDVGGRLAGGFLTDAVSSFEEGLQIRSVKLYPRRRTGRGHVPHPASQHPRSGRKLW